MKKLIFVILAFLLSSPVSSVAQNRYGRWDEKGKAYLNYNYGFMWHLDPELSWEPQASLFQRNAIFAAKDVETNIVVYITAIEGAGKGNDIWPMESEYRRGLYDGFKKYGNSAKVLDFKRCQLAGKHALKSKSLFIIKNDDRMLEDLYFIMIGYTILLHGNAITFQAMAPKELEDYLNEHGLSISNTLFNGILLDVKKSLR